MTVEECIETLKHVKVHDVLIGTKQLTEWLEELVWLRSEIARLKELYKPDFDNVDLED